MNFQNTWKLGSLWEPTLKFLGCVFSCKLGCFDVMHLLSVHFEYPPASRTENLVLFLLLPAI